MSFTFRRPRKTNRSHAADRAGFNEAKPSPKGRVLLFLFGLPFFAAGLFFGWIGAIQPLAGVIESRSWPQVPCRIVTSEIETNRSSDGNTYRVAITFDYAFEGNTYIGGRYDFDDVSSSGYDGKSAIVARHPVGSETVCWVNPLDPAEAVLSRSIPGTVYFIIPFSGLFMLVGGGIMLGSAGLLPRRWSAKLQPKHQPLPEADQREVTLKPASGPVAKLVGTILFGAFWNGIVGVFVWQVVDSFRTGNPEWFLVFFLVPFVAVGIGFLGGVAYFALALANPRFRLTLSEGNPRLGSQVRLTWHTSGALHRLSNLAITLEGHETATYKVGTRSTTDKSLFFREPVFETDVPAAHRNGHLTFSIPPDQMHSFSAAHNKIEWSLHVTGPIRRWPDVNDRYPLTVRPLAPED